MEVAEGCPSSNVYKTGNIEEKIDDGTEHGLFCLSVEETIPSKRGTTTESGEEVVSAEHGSCSDYQEGKGNVLGNVGLTIDQPSTLAELHEMPETVTKDGTVDNRKDYLNCWMKKVRLDEIRKMKAYEVTKKEQLT